jgi:transposase InsO family protein
MSDFKSVILVGTKLTLAHSADQFEDWRDLVEGLFKARDLHQYLTDPSKTGVKEAQTAHILRENVEYGQFKAHFKQASHVSEVWSALQQRWAKSTLASKLLVCEQLYTLDKSSTEGLLAFLTRCTNLYCELETAGFLNEGMFVYKVTKVLKSDPKYSTWVDIVRAKGQLPKFNDLADQAREFFAAEINQEQQIHPIEGAFKASSTPISCDYCGYNYHVKADCRFYKRDQEKGELKPNGWYKKNHQWRKGHKRPGPHKSNFAGALIMPAAFQAVTEDKHGFMIDSGATHHMVKDALLLRNTKPTQVNVTTANQEVLQSTMKGEAIIVNHNGEKVLLKEVLLLPSLTCNLLSVNKANEAGLKVEFSSNGKVAFMQTMPRKKLLSGRAVGSLYEIDGYAMALGTSYSTSSANVAQRTTTSTVPLGGATMPKSSLLWHRRLGHLGLTSLSKMAVNRRVIGLPSAAEFTNMPVCWACAAGKITRNPFPVSSTQTCRPLECLHIDIAGPMQVTSAGGAKYFVTTLDDYSKFKAVRTIARKSEAPTFVKHIIQHWESMTGHKTVAVRHDRAKEFMAQELKEWYESKGIEMQPTSGYSPQENGAAERLNRTLWETTLAMLADSGLPQKWWGEATVHAAHLRNVTCSTGGPTPWELMKGEKPDVSTIKIFGSPCMVRVPDQKRHKLQPKSEPGRILGFDLPNLKAYKVLTSSGEVVRSRDVIAQEDFESKADRIMYDFETDIGIIPTPAPATSVPTTTIPTIPTLAPSAVVPTPDKSASSSESIPSPEAEQQTQSGHHSTRSTKGVPPERLEPSFRLMQQIPLLY